MRLSDYRRNKVGGLPLEMLQRWTGHDGLALFGRMPTEVDLDLLLPPEFRPDGARQPTTIITDDFNRADGELGANWTDDTGDADIVSNQWDATAVTVVSRYSGASLSSVDHYAQAKIMNSPAGNAGPMARKEASGALTYYVALKNGSPTAVVQLYSRVAGTHTQLGANIADSWTSGDTYQVRCNVSTISFWKNGSSVADRTDTAITGNLQTGLVSNDAAQAMDDFEALELTGAATVKFRGLMLTGIGL